MRLSLITPIVLFAIGPFFSQSAVIAGELTFDELDLNGDGVLSREEFQRADVERTNVNNQSTSGKFTVVDDQHTETAVELEDEVENTLLDKFADRWSIRKSYLTSDDESLPGKFSWSNPSRAGEFYSTDFAVQYIAWDGWFMGGQYEVHPTYESHLSTEDGKVRDSQSFRIPITWISEDPTAPGWGDDWSVVAGGDGFIQNHVVTASPVWETDRTQDVEAVGGDIFYTVNVNKGRKGKSSWLWRTLGVRNPVGGRYGSEFYWRPWIGVEGGSYLDDGGVAEILGVDDYLRIAPRIKADYFVTDKLLLSAEYLYRHDFINDDGFHFFDASAVMYLDPEEKVAVGLSYEYGRTAPKFTDVDVLEGWIGVKF
ncbi:MAG: EF-hand domain-containing protein [Verrucomicrobiota bacterium]